LPFGDFIICKLDIKAVPALEAVDYPQIPVCGSDPALGKDFDGLQNSIASRFAAV
jgi:hypothetical protein